MTSVPELSKKIKPLFMLITIIAVAILFAINTPQPTPPPKSVSPDAIIFEDGRSILVTASGRTWVMEV